MLRLSQKKNIVRLFIMTAVVVAVSLTASIFLIKDRQDSNAYTQDGATVHVHNNGTIYPYGDYGTHWHKVDVPDGVTYDAYCAQPDLDSYQGDKQAHIINEGGKYNSIKLMMYIRENDNAYTANARNLLFSNIKNDSYWGNSESIRLYTFTHAVIGAIYDKDYEGLEGGEKQKVKDAKNVILPSLINNNDPSWQMARNYILYYVKGGELKQDIVWIEPTGSITVNKCDVEIYNNTNPHACIAQGNGNFDGITFTLYKGSTPVDSKTLSGGANSVTFSGLDTSATYTVVESGSNAYYDLTASSQSAKPSPAGTVLDFLNTVKRGNLTVNKIDKETGTCVNIGELSFAGTTLKLFNRSANSIFFQNRIIASGEEIMTKVLSTDECSFAVNSLPYGSYGLVETAAATGYVLDNTEKIINIPTSNSAEVTYSFENQPIRGDIKFTKRDKDNNRLMKNTLFSISSIDSNYNIKETHIVVSDQNGVVDTSANIHSFNTNGYDEPYNEAVDEIITYAGYGSWFGLDKNGNKLSVRDNLGALPYGRYIIQELKCEGNIFCTNIINQKATVQITEHGTVVDLGDWENTCKKFTIETAASDGADGDKYVEASEQSVIKDKISYCGKKNISFTIKGVLMDKTTGEKLLVNGQPVEQSIDVKPTEDCGEAEMLFNVDTSELAGKEVVVFEYLYYKDELMTKHEDIEDESQTVGIISLETYAVNNETNEKILPYDSETVVKDTVKYCLKTGLEYTIKGRIIDKKTGSELLINGEPIEQIATITPEETCGEIEMFYPLNTTGLAGSELIIFESLYLGDQLLIAHTDLNNESESFSVEMPVPDTGFVSEDSKGNTTSSNTWIIEAVIIVIPVGLYTANRIRKRKSIYNR